MGTPLSQHNKVCKYCKKDFVTHYIRAHFCSKQCAYKNGRKKLKQDKINNPQKYIKRKQKYKNKKQQKEIREGKVVIGISKQKCVICSKTYIINHKQQKYCSKECGIQAQKNRYNKKIKTQGRKEFNDRWNNWYRKNKGYEPKKEINCCICGKIFLRQRISQKYCKNEECKLKYLRKKGIEKYYRDKDKILERRKNNVNYCIMNKLRMRISCAVKSQGAYKATKTINLVGCSVEKLKQHLEKQFVENMNWSNYGLYGWHIDHIKPCASFDLTKKEEQLKCFNYKNLQPLWARDNLQKNSKV